MPVSDVRDRACGATARSLEPPASLTYMRTHQRSEKRQLYFTANLCPSKPCVHLLDEGSMARQCLWTDQEGTTSLYSTLSPRGVILRSHAFDGGIACRNAQTTLRKFVPVKYQSKEQKINTTQEKQKDVNCRDSARKPVLSI